MKKSQLKQFIKEEIRSCLKEMDDWQEKAYPTQQRLGYLPGPGRLDAEAEGEMLESVEMSEDLLTHMHDTIGIIFDKELAFNSDDAVEIYLKEYPQHDKFKIQLKQLAVGIFDDM